MKHLSSILFIYFSFSTFAKIAIKVVNYSKGIWVEKEEDWHFFQESSTKGIFYLDNELTTLTHELPTSVIKYKVTHVDTSDDNYVEMTLKDKDGVVYEMFIDKEDKTLGIITGNNKGTFITLYTYESIRKY